MKNLLDETINILTYNNKTLEDIKWVGTRNYYVDIDIFLHLANTRYDSGYGAPKVAENLLIVGNGWFLERHEYDGLEWWEYNQTLEKPENKLELKALTIDQAKKKGFDVSCGWETLESINGLKNYDEDELDEE